MSDKYKILILSNPKNNEYIEDIWIKEAFEKDGHLVSIQWVDYEDEVNKFDLIIRRNTWVEDKKDIEIYDELNMQFISKIINKKIKTVNLIGLDGNGKGYLCDLYKKGYDVIPSVNMIKDFELIPKTYEYIIKSCKSFGSAINQITVTADQIKDIYVEGNIIQPKTKFKAEVQCYFVGDELMYVHEYVPSKYPNYPEPTLIELTEKEKNKLKEFCKYSNLVCGFQRIDFIRLENDTLLLLEIEDNSPNMNLGKLDLIFREKVINKYKENIYKYLKS